MGSNGWLNPQAEPLLTWEDRDWIVSALFLDSLTEQTYPVELQASKSIFPMCGRKKKMDSNLGGDLSKHYKVICHFILDVNI